MFLYLSRILFLKLIYILITLTNLEEIKAIQKKLSTYIIKKKRVYNFFNNYCVSLFIHIRHTFLDVSSQVLDLRILLLINLTLEYLSTLIKPHTFHLLKTHIAYFWPIYHSLFLIYTILSVLPSCTSLSLQDIVINNSPSLLLLLAQNSIFEQGKTVVNLQLIMIFVR